MNPAVETELWAQEGVDRLCEPYRARLAPTDIDLREAAVMIRAAYAKGYGAALTEAEPLTPAEAKARLRLLMLLVPVR